MDPRPRPGRRHFFNTLYFRVVVGILLGIAVGLFFPHVAVTFKPFGDGFIKLVRMLVAPIIFFTVVIGIAGIGDTHKLGRVGIRALVYFEIVTTFALAIGYFVAKIVQPGRGMNVDPKSLDVSVVSQYVTAGKHLGVVDFLLNIIPDSFAGAFVNGEILQVLLLAILTGIAMLSLDQEQRLLRLSRSLSHLFFRITAIVMEFAPLAAFGAMAFTIGKYGIATLFSLGKVLLCVYLTCIGFIAIVLGTICYLNKINLWKLIVYLKEELLIVIGTSSSEPALPGLIAKMERLGCSEVVAGLVILMLNSKGAAAVTGGGFITLAATLSAFGTIPVAGITLLLGIDRFMSEMRSITNLLGNAVATIVVARWEDQFDAHQATFVLNNNYVLPIPIEDAESAETPATR
jgi:aerobic C4-dicarboxylate transport protein